MKWPELADIETRVPPPEGCRVTTTKPEQRWKVLFPEFDVEPEPT